MLRQAQHERVKRIAGCPDQVRACAILLALFALPPPAAAAPVVSPKADAVSVTIYRDPNRGTQQAMDRNWLNGFALVTETRTIDLPAGPSELRFEGVAGGILPPSAIVKGLPGGTIEKDRDAKLLSPGALIAANLGERVHVTRTNIGSGKVTEEDAIVRAGPNGVVIQDKAGVEALGCSGMPEALSYDAVPAGLTAKPTLSVTTVSPVAAHVTVTLSYLASGFDWQANYVATLGADGKTLDLTGWLTLANSNRESFPGAGVQAVAGKLNSGDMRTPPPEGQPIRLRCWPTGVSAPQAPPPPPPAPMVMRAGFTEDIVVTGMKRMVATQEELGDLKLYRVPLSVTVAAAATKQIGLLDATGVTFRRVYLARIPADLEDDEPQPLHLTLRTKNLPANHLGLPLPLGQLDLFDRQHGARLLVAETGVRDLAIGEQWEIDAGASPQVRLANGGDGKARTLTITNANPFPVAAEVSLDLDDGAALTGVKLARKDGRPLWVLTVPANASRSISYRIREPS